MGWIFMRFPGWYEQGQKDLFAPDLQKDAFYRWMDRNSLVLPIGLAVLLFFLVDCPHFCGAFVSPCVGVSLNLVCQFRSAYVGISTLQK